MIGILDAAVQISHSIVRLVFEIQLIRMVDQPRAERQRQLIL